VDTSADNRRVGGGAGTVSHEGVDQLRFQMVLVTTLAGPLHGAAMGFGTDLSGFRHRLDFIGTLVQAQIMEQVLQRDELARRMGTGADLATDDLDPVHHPGVKVLILAQRVVDPAAALDHPGQDVINVGYRERIIEAKALDGTFGAGQEAVPQFFLRVPLLAEQDRLAVLPSRNEHQYGFRLTKSSQVLEVAVLAERMQDITITDP